MSTRHRVARFLSPSRWQDLRRWKWLGRVLGRAMLRAVLVPIYYPFGLLLAAFNVRFLVSRVAGPSFGHQALDPALYVASELVGGHPRYRAVMVAPPWRVVNRALLDCWRERFFLISNPVAALLLTPFHWVRPVSYQIYCGDTVFPDGRGGTLEGGPAEDEIMRRYALEHPDRPLASVTHEQRERGAATLREMGMPAGAWWACLHVREPGWYAPRRLDVYRDADPLSYLEAVRAITESGGWVVRIGDPTMTPLPRMDCVIDYPHTDWKADWMDVFLIAHCRFLLGSSSGATAVALMFGRPAAVANQIPMGHGVWNDMIYIPKLYRSAADDRLLSFEEVLLSDRRDWSADREFLEGGVGWRDNTPAEIRDLAIETMDRLDGRFSATPDDEALQSAFWKLFAAGRTRTGWGTNSRVGRQFLRDHENLLPAVSGRAASRGTRL